MITQFDCKRTYHRGVESVTTLCSKEHRAYCISAADYHQHQSPHLAHHPCSMRVSDLTETAVVAICSWLTLRSVQELSVNLLLLRFIVDLNVVLRLVRVLCGIVLRVTTIL